MDKFKDVLTPKRVWESHELDAYVDYPERRKHPALQKADTTISAKPRKHNDQIRGVADSYAAAKGITLNHDMPTLKVNSDHAAKIADAYQNMKHDPNHPAVKSAYDALINETSEQFNHITGAGGLKVSKMKPGMQNPYKTSADLHADLKNNNHMWYYPTDQGFGTEEAGSDHPMLRPTGHTDDEGKPMVANDLFRIVHDYFGHGKEGFGFGSAGEENTWAHHKQMFSPEAQKALTTETRGQNSWVNFGPHGENNRANPSQTVYAQQKAGLMPDWTNEHSHGEAPATPATGIPQEHKMHKSEEPVNGQVFMAYDGDNAGRLVGRAILADDPQELHDVSNRIAHGHDVVKDWVEAHGGQVISGGGDEGTFIIPAQAVSDIEKLRADYKYATNLSTTIGFGNTLSEAGKALMVGKFRGKDQVCHYDASVETDLAKAKDDVANGSADPEEKKLGEAYLTPDKGSDMNMRPQDPHDDCPYCQELAQDGVQDDDHCQYCHGAESAETEPHCQYCAEADQAQANDHDHDDENCQYCQDAENAAANPHEHSGDDCEYCAAANAHDPNAADHADDCQYCAAAEQDPSQTSQPGADAEVAGSQAEMQAIAQNIDQTTPQDGEAAVPAQVPTDDGGQNSPADLGLAEDDQDPNLNDVLQTGLDQHADQIAREKVINMVSEALQGFKACKPIIERAQEQAPQLYQSSLAMLKAMIEMAKMLGLSEQGEENPLDGQEQNPQDPQSNPQPGQQAPPQQAQTQQGDASAGKPMGR